MLNLPFAQLHPLARWFCDITLRRLAKTISLGGAQAKTDHSDDDDSPDSQERVPAEPLDGTSGWGAASAPTSGTVAFRDVAGMEAPEAGLRVSGESRVGGGKTSRLSGSNYYRFRTFTVVCALTGVTEKGAKVAEAMSPGLMVVFKDQPLACRA